MYAGKKTLRPAGFAESAAAVLLNTIPFLVLGLAYMVQVQIEIGQPQAGEQVQRRD